MSKHTLIVTVGDELSKDLKEANYQLRVGDTSVRVQGLHTEKKAYLKTEPPNQVCGPEIKVTFDRPDADRGNYWISYSKNRKADDEKLDVTEYHRDVLSRAKQVPFGQIYAIAPNGDVKHGEYVKSDNYSSWVPEGGRSIGFSNGIRARAIVFKGEPSSGTGFKPHDELPFWVPGDGLIEISKPEGSTADAVMVWFESYFGGKDGSAPDDRVRHQSIKNKVELKDTQTKVEYDGNSFKG